jgi:hypothetical protein
MASFVRFVCSGSNAGIFQAAYDIISTGAIRAEERTELEDMLRWFEANLATPDRLVRTTSKGYYRRDTAALSWFKDDAQACIRNVWSLVRLLEQNGVAVELIRTSNPGYVTYEDDNQVAAIPFSDR